MPQRGKHVPGTDEGFRQAIAQWRLDLRTEVKKSSSLPTAMFDACDPMLETRLAETAQTILSRLHGPAIQDVSADAAAVEKRLEQVTSADLRRLPRQIAEVSPAALDLEAGLLPEYLGILTDTCCNATGSAQLGAATLLDRDFRLSATTDMATLSELLARQVRETPEQFAKAASYTDDALALACQRVAAALALHVHGPTNGDRG